MEAVFKAHFIGSVYHVVSVDIIVFFCYSLLVVFCFFYFYKATRTLSRKNYPENHIIHQGCTVEPNNLYCNFEFLNNAHHRYFPFFM